MSQFETIFDIVSHPYEAFIYLKEKGVWGWSFFLYIFFKITTSFTIIPYTIDTIEPGLRIKLQQSGINEDQIENILRSQFYGPLRYLNSIGEGIKAVIAIFFLCFLVWLTITIVKRRISGNDFNLVFSIISNSSVVLILGQITILILAISGAPNFINLAVFVQHINTNIFVLSICSFVDPFNIWMMGITIYGCLIVFDLKEYDLAAFILSFPITIFILSLSLLTWIGNH